MFFAFFPVFLLFLISFAYFDQQDSPVAVGTRKAIEQLRDTMASETGKFLGGSGDIMCLGSMINDHNVIII